ncbi:MAG: pantetheine-phosphate adenylyltransferase [Candidatus Kapabacteria bacterium]|nr:pantetheine-phosphate adenylyltransferase [Candidatus Kapabacteria bacterium]MDW8011636.1 pantetheine-phosphate adenylyltransferase [Bacteroidota bacterium]
MERPLRRAIYPGTFDPITNGHVDVIERAAQLFDHVIVLIGQNPAKQPLFSETERRQMVEESVAHLLNVSVDVYHGLIVDYARQCGAVAIIRGLRAISDFEYELQMALINRQLAPSICTVFMAPNERYIYVNSSIVRELVRFGHVPTDLVPEPVARRLRLLHAQHP